MMKTILFLLVLSSCGCGDDALPSCADLGCPHRPSGSPEIWEPCPSGEVCWCRNPHTAEHESLMCEPGEVAP